ncbi:MAG: DNA methylase [Oscillospiraceae bacterium]|nr:DNA methylase [Oscillospiraceae bacterium]
MENKTYICIDLKSFFASVECVERGLDPMTTNLVVADASKTEKTICLAVSPSLKAYGISGRARLFEVVQRVSQVNAERKRKINNREFTGSSCNCISLDENPQLMLDYIIAPPRMSYYMDYSTRVYNVYLKYVSAEDIHVYSIDEVFIDVTHYLKTYAMSAHELAKKIIKDVLKTTGITATAGIGTNMYLAKIAMDIMAKRIKADEYGVRIAELDEMTYRQQLWEHKPLTDFWRVGKGYAKKLADHGIYTMGDIARCSLGEDKEYYNESLLYDLFGVNAELLIDHAWGWEPCTIADIKAYRPQNSSISRGQVLHCPYTFEKARLIVREMADLIVLELVDKNLVTDQIVLTIGYDIENLSEPSKIQAYKGQVTTDHYGRKVPKPAHGSINIDDYTSSTKLITEKVIELYDNIVSPNLLIRRINIALNHIEPFGKQKNTDKVEQLDLFTDYKAIKKKQQEEKQALDKEKKIQQAVLSMKKRFGKNAVLKGMNLEEGATAKERNKQIGGHKA